MIWVPYYCTGEEERIIRDIYRRADLESSEARPLNCSIPSALVITAQSVQSFTIDIVLFQYTFLLFLKENWKQVAIVAAKNLAQMCPIADKKM
jgi:hypothetical protein